MAEIIYENKPYTALPGETVLDTLLRHGVSISFSCRRGVCQACILKCDAGDLPEDSTRGLRTSWQDQGYFLSCLCPASASLVVSSVDSCPAIFRYVVVAKQLLAPSILQLILRPASATEAMKCLPGQHLNLQVDSISRTYSIANVPEEDQSLELHIKVLPDGVFSQVLATGIDVGRELGVQGPMGDCCYSADIDNMNLLCLGVGVGLAPLLGVIRDALQKGHQREISLLHGALDLNGIYATDQIHALSYQYSNFHYQRCVLDGRKMTDSQHCESVVEGDIYELAINLLTEPSRTAVFLCGSADFVAEMQKKLFFRGVRRSAIFVETFQAS